MNLRSTEPIKHSIYFEPSKCNGDMACLKICPVEAIRIRDGKARMLEDKCIDCGECVKACKLGAIVPLTNTFKDFSRFEYTVAIPTLALYTQFDRNVRPKTILSSLKKTGFDEVKDISRACVSVVRATGKYIKEYYGRKPLISSFCPTCVKLIQVRYPELISSLVPVISPIELAAYTARKEISARLKIDKEEIGVIYITPCPSKMIFISQKTESYESSFDGAIPISEIYNTLYSAIHQLKGSLAEDIEYFDISGFGLNFARTGGLEFMMGNENCITVAGINNVLFILDEIEKGKLHNVNFVEMHACPEGCLGGPMTVENVYIARTNLLNLISYFGETRIPIGKKDEYNNDVLFNDKFFEQLPGEQVNVDIKIALNKMIEKKKFYNGLPKTNCGACGSPTCETFAEDFVNGEVKSMDCKILENERLKQIIKDNEFGNAGE